MVKKEGVLEESHVCGRERNNWVRADSQVSQVKWYFLSTIKCWLSPAVRRNKVHQDTGLGHSSQKGLNLAGGNQKKTKTKKLWRTINGVFRQTHGAINNS